MVPDPSPSGGINSEPGQFSTSCCVTFRHGKMILENPSPELLAALEDTLRQKDSQLSLVAEAESLLRSALARARRKIHDVY